MKVKRPYNQERHVLTVFGIFVCYYILMRLWPSFQPGVTLIFLYAGMLAQLSSFRFRYHLLAHTVLIASFSYLVREPEWIMLTLICVACYLIGRFCGQLTKETVDKHLAIARRYQYDLNFAKKTQAAEEQRRYEETVKKILEEERNPNRSFKKKSEPVEAKVIQFKK